MSRAYGTGRVPDLLIREAQERLEEQRAVVRHELPPFVSALFNTVISSPRLPPPFLIYSGCTEL
jgi:hypothetical protein